ncbi:MAG: hypothetical protein JWL62_3136 [Hyphomicrobiales bacterium]|nr:hypothetical protein [Hyphomicrobiales bacterium]
MFYALHFTCAGSSHSVLKPPRFVGANVLASNGESAVGSREVLLVKTTSDDLHITTSGWSRP